MRCSDILLLAESPFCDISHVRPLDRTLRALVSPCTLRRLLQGGYTLFCSSVGKVLQIMHGIRKLGDAVAEVCEGLRWGPTLVLTLAHLPCEDSE